MDQIFLYDTTLRDGQQTQGVQFTYEDKFRVVKALDNLGLDYIEGGWPGANPTDTEFFQNPPKIKNSILTAFGMTKRVGISANNDNILASVVNSETKAVCLVGKSYDYHVKKVLGISNQENLINIEESIKHLVKSGKEAIFDAEHFFDGFKSDPKYAFECLLSAYQSDADWIILCDTNGGTLPNEINEIVKSVIKMGIPGNKLGIHSHNDTENAVANSFAAIDAGVRQIQGTINGLGERCGNANLISIIPSLILKKHFNNRFKINIDKTKLKEITKLSRILDEILNRVPNKASPYVGAAAFTHKAGLHASAILKDPKTYEHINPSEVGNVRVIPASNQAGKSNLIKILNESGVEIEKNDDRISKILQEIKEKEDKGYTFDVASASFEIFARKKLGLMPHYFSVNRYKVTMEKRQKVGNQYSIISEAVVSINLGNQEQVSIAESLDNNGEDQGPVHALSAALKKDLGSYQSFIEDIKLVDFKVRIMNGGTEAITRVLIDSEDRNGLRWSTIGVSANIIDASYDAILDSINWKLLRENATPVQ
ncbi:MAG: citramalate synthase [Paracoccaceae bacterium]